MKPSGKIPYSVWIYQFLLMVLPTFKMRLRAHLYNGDQKPCPVPVTTQCKLAPKYVGPQDPLTESILAERRIQPYVHDCLVSIQDDRCTHHFRVFLKCHAQLCTNKYLVGKNNFDMHRSLFVMHVATMDCGEHEEWWCQAVGLDDWEVSGPNVWQAHNSPLLTRFPEVIWGREVPHWIIVKKRTNSYRAMLWRTWWQRLQFIS